MKQQLGRNRFYFHHKEIPFIPFPFGFQVHSSRPEPRCIKGKLLCLSSNVIVMIFDIEIFNDIHIMGIWVISKKHGDSIRWKHLDACILPLLNTGSGYQ